MSAIGRDRDKDLTGTTVTMTTRTMTTRTMQTRTMTTRTMTTRTAFTAPSFLLRLAAAAAMIFFVALLSRAGGPKCVAGTSYFDPTTTGQPLVWPQGLISYYTDQGDLSPILPNASANSFVASAFSVWT